MVSVIAGTWRLSLLVNDLDVNKTQCEPSKDCRLPMEKHPKCYVTFETFSLGLPLKTGRLSADVRAGDALSRSIWRVTAVSIDRERVSHASSACSVSAHIHTSHWAHAENFYSEVSQWGHVLGCV